MTMLQFESASELRAHYAGVRSRLNNPPQPRIERKPAPSIFVPDLVEDDDTPHPISIDDIKRETCRIFGITRIDLVSHRRTQAAVIPRQVAVALSRLLTTCSLPMIGRHFGGRDHTTVLYSIKKMQTAIDMVKDRVALDAPASEWVLAVRDASAQLPEYQPKTLLRLSGLRRNWTSDEVQRAIDMRTDNKTYEEIAISIGRTRHAVAARLKYEFMTPHRRAARAEYIRQWRRENAGGVHA